MRFLFQSPAPSIQKKSHVVRNIVAGFIAVLVVLLILYFVALPLLSSPFTNPIVNQATQPNIQVTNLNVNGGGFVNSLSCIANARTVTVTFTLVNSGNANGYAEVELVSNGNQIQTNNYYVSQGCQSPETIQFQAGCSQQNVYVQILSETK